MKKIYHRIPEEVQAMKLEDTNESILEAFEWINNEDISDDKEECRDVISFIREHGGIEYFTEEGISKVLFNWYIVKTPNGKIESYSPDTFNKMFE